MSRKKKREKEKEKEKEKESSFSEEKEAKRLPKREGFGKAYSKQNKAKSRSGKNGPAFCSGKGKRVHGGSNPLHAKTGARTKQNAIRRAR